MQIISASSGVAGNEQSRFPDLSTDGAAIVFQSDATNLGIAVTNGVTNVYVREGGTLTLESVATGGSPQSNAFTSTPSISGDGNYVVFHSQATNLAPGATSGMYQVYLRDRAANTTTLVSGTATNGAGNALSVGARISDDGEYVVFESDASNLIASPPPGRGIYRWKRTTGVHELVSASPTAGPGLGVCGSPSPSPDGRHVYFWDGSSNYFPSLGNGIRQAYLKDMQTGQLTLLSQNAAATQAGDGASGLGEVSANGEWVVFESDAANLLPGTFPGTDVYLWHRSGTLTQLSHAYAGLSGTVPANGVSRSASISANGRFVAFASTASNLLYPPPGATGGQFNVWVLDRDVDGDGSFDEPSDQTAPLLTHAGVLPNGSSHNPRISDDGRFVAFWSAATSWTTTATGGFDQAYLHDGATRFVPYCFGDGTGAPCPCANSGSPGAGCDTSSLTGGGRLSGSGAACVGADTLTLCAQSLNASTFALLFQGGTAINNNGFGSLFGNGLRCVASPILRLATRPTTSGAVCYGSGVSGSSPISVLGAVSASGGTRYYQVWFRDNPPQCPGSSGGFNFTNGLLVYWAP